ncbi:MAG: DUF1343 domain-containing protein [Bacteroidales bacterium]
MKSLMNIRYSGFLLVGLILLSGGIMFESKGLKATDHSGLSVAAGQPLKVGAERTDLYFPLLRERNIGVAGNHTSMVGNTHLVDTLLAMNFNVVKVFSPEHGFRGQAAAGEKVDDGKDPRTGLPIVSLYGSNRSPSPEQLEGLDLIVFDMQDVGTRFYTYISTMTLIMREAARMDIPVIILDRPNPNGHFVDGPVLELEFASFVGMHPVPVVHGMTIGEYARMVNGEDWLGAGLTSELLVIPVENYTHSTYYALPVAPSPNLPNMHSVYLYPSLCFFEGTQVSVGRGTSKPFQVFGHSSFDKDDFNYSFIPQSVSAAPDPPQKDLQCYGRDLSSMPLESLQRRDQLDLNYLMHAFSQFPEKEHFFNNYFEKLAGTRLLQSQIMAGLPEEVIRESWQEDLEQFKIMRARYLLYPDFE